MTKQRRTDQRTSDSNTTAEGPPDEATPTTAVHLAAAGQDTLRNLADLQVSLAGLTDTILLTAATCGNDKATQSPARDWQNGVKPKTELLNNPTNQAWPFESQRNLTAKPAAEFLGVSEQTLANWRWQGWGPPFEKMGRRITYRIQDLLDFKASCRRHSTSDKGGQDV